MSKKSRNKNKHFHYFLFGSIFLIIFAGLSYGMVEYSRRSSFCRDCHEMGSAHDTWMASKHGPLLSDIDNCYVCHAKEGFFGYVASKFAGVKSLYFHITNKYDEIGGRKKPVFCIKSGCHTLESIDKNLKINVNHIFHLDRGNKCVDCHNRIAHGWDPDSRNTPSMDKFCFKCHDNTTAPKDQCDLCHVFQDKMLRGKGAMGIEDYPSAHAEELVCQDCHSDACSPTMTPCQNCHEQEIITSYKLRQFEICKDLENLNGYLKQLERIFSMPKYKLDTYNKEKELYEFAKHNYNFILNDKTKGFHNFTYCEDTLFFCLKNMEEVMNKFVGAQTAGIRH